ncbi:MAG: hypothetical protein ACPGVT_00915 [Maricaulaceae bacterium]
MKFIGYIGIFLAIFAGYNMMHPGLILVFAFVVTLSYVKARRNIDNEAARVARPNPFVDGAYLFVVQLLVIFVAYCVGYFAASSAGDSFLAFLKGGR